MAFNKVDIKSLVIGLVIGIIAVLTLGAASRGNNPGQYQVSISVNARNVFYAKIHTGTGEIETWQTSITSVPTKRQ
jgi:hypothetical protein